MENKAAIFCLECGTYQCSKCEYTLHSTRETKLHSRERLTAQGGGGRGKPCELWCEPRNPLAVRCGECGLETCKECDTRMHQGKRRSHVRQQITPMALAKRDGSTGDRGTDTVMVYCNILHCNSSPTSPPLLENQPLQLWLITLAYAYFARRGHTFDVDQVLSLPAVQYLL